MLLLLFIIKEQKKIRNAWRLVQQGFKKLSKKLFYGALNSETILFSANDETSLYLGGGGEGRGAN